MTVSQAQRLWRYSLALGYEAELHYTDRRGLRGVHDPSVTLRLRKPGLQWSWVFGWRDWLAVVRADRALGAAQGSERGEETSFFGRRDPAIRYNFRGSLSLHQKG